MWQAAAAAAAQCASLSAFFCADTDTADGAVVVNYEAMLEEVHVVMLRDPRDGCEQAAC